MELQTVVAILPPTLARPTKSRRLLKGRHAASFHTSVKPLLINVGFSLLSTKKKLKISVENMNDLKQVFENPKSKILWNWTLGDPELCTDAYGN